jgi:hypothetical protein
MTGPLVPAAAVTGLLSAVHAALPEADGTQPVTGTDLVRAVTSGLLRRGVDEFALAGAAVLLRESIGEAQ